jgi:hypothetical protein
MAVKAPAGRAKPASGTGFASGGSQFARYDEVTETKNERCAVASRSHEMAVKSNETQPPGGAGMTAAGGKYVFSRSPEGAPVRGDAGYTATRRGSWSPGARLPLISSASASVFRLYLPGPQTGSVSLKKKETPISASDEM